MEMLNRQIKNLIDKAERRGYDVERRLVLKDDVYAFDFFVERLDPLYQTVQEKRCGVMVTKDGDYFFGYNPDEFIILTEDEDVEPPDMSFHEFQKHLNLIA